MKKSALLFATFILVIAGLVIKILFVYAAATTWAQTDWSGGGGQTAWSDTTKFNTSTHINYATPGSAKLSSTYSEWAQTYGGSSDDYSMSTKQTSDGGYIISGAFYYPVAADYDFFVSKVDSSGVITWQKTYAGAGGGDDIPKSIQQTSDGGYIVAGDSFVTGGTGYDIWILKLDSTGTVMWQKTYGGTGFDYDSAIQQTSDGGYIVAGHTTSSGAGGIDAWILKLNSSGVVTWQKTYGGASDEYIKSIQQTLDGGYIVAGYTNSFGAGLEDLWILKLDSTGAVTWQKTYGGASYDDAQSIQQTTDGGYIVAGYTGSFGAGSYDAWILKLDSTGAVTWQKTYGGASYDYAQSIQQTTDGGYIVAGYTGSFGAGSSDAWVLKLDSTGAVTWQKTYGGTGLDYAFSVQQTSDGGYVVAGQTASFGAGSGDIWVLKLDPSGSIGLSCAMVAVSTAATAISAAATAISAAATATSTVVPAVSTATPVGSSASTSLQCSVENGYYSSGAITSSIYDAGTSYTWGPLTYSATTPANTSVSFEVSTDGGIIWQAVTDYVTQIFGPSQTIVYRATLANTDNVSTPILQDISIGGNLVPTVTTSPASSLLRTGATLNGAITATGGTNATTRGFNYGLTTSYGSTTTDSGSYGTGAFTADLANLNCSATYHFRAYATNTAGTGYGDDASFTTAGCPSSGSGRITPPPPVLPPPVVLPIAPPIVPPVTVIPPVIVLPVTTPRVIPPVVTPPSPTAPPGIVSTPIINTPIPSSVVSSPLTTIRTITTNSTVKTFSHLTVAIPTAVSLFVLLASLLSGMPFLNYLFYLLVVLAQFLGFAIKPKPWGTIYDSYTKRPLAYARVEILNDQSRKLQSTITDANGRYGFIISEQLSNAQLRAYLTKYDFPSKAEPSVVEQKLYPNIYRGGPIDVSSGVTNFDLPMDPRDKTFTHNFYFGISSIKLNNILTSVANISFALGVILGLTNALVNPSVTSFTVLAIILLTFILRTSGFKLKPFGLTKDLETNRVLPFGFIALHNQGGERMNFTVSDQAGRYFLLTPKGNYLLKAYTPSHISPMRTKEIPVSTSKGWISREIEI